MKKRNKLLIKLGILCTAFVGLITALVVPTKAYYVDSNGNLASSNLMNPDFINDNSLSITDYHTINDYGLIANTDYTLSFQALTANYFYYRVNWSSDNYTSWVRSDSSLTFNIGSYTEFSIVADRVYDKSLFNLMLNTGSTPLDYEVYGAIYYSQANYNAYGSENASYIATPYNAYIEYYTNDLDSSLCTYYFVYHGDRYVHAEKTSVNSNLEIYNLTTEQKELIDNSFVSDYGWFIEDYGSYNGIVGFLNEFASNPNRYLDKPWKVVFEYQAPVKFVNTPFNIGDEGIANVYYDNQLITSIVAPGFQNFTANRFEIVGQNDFGVKSIFLSSNPMDSYWVGYFKGFNIQQEKIEQLENANAILLQQLNNASSTNANALFWTIAATPFESFKTIWNVDVLGLNISGFVLGVLLALIILYIIKKVW